MESSDQDPCPQDLPVCLAGEGASLTKKAKHSSLLCWRGTGSGGFGLPGIQKIPATHILGSGVGRNCRVQKRSMWEIGLIFEDSLDEVMERWGPKQQNGACHHQVSGNSTN